MDKTNAKKILAITCLAYFSFGCLWAAIGPLLSSFADRNSTTLSAIGSIYSAVFLGAFISQISLGPLTDKWGQLRSLTISLFILALGIIGVSFSRSLTLTLVLAFTAGLGHGMTNLTGNVLVGRLFDEKSVSALNVVNVFFGIGAFIGPLLVSASIALWNNGFPALWFSATVMLLAGTILLVKYFNIQLGSGVQLPPGQQQARMRYTGFLWSLGVMILVYVGSESAMGGWATTYMQATTSLKIELAAMVTSGFWLAITIGRLNGAYLGTRLAARQVLIFSLSAAALGAIVFVVSYGQSVLSIIAVLLIGFGFGAIYPTVMAMVTTAFPKTPGQAGSVITAMSGVGGMLIPWLQGVIMEQTSIRMGTYFFALLTVLLILSYVLNQSLVKSETQLAA